MLSEMGSEFWEAGPVKNDKKFFLSGRTALEYIIRDILAGNNMKSVLLPSYCCHTMIEPFCRHGISVRFYNVYFDKKQGLCVDIPKPLPDEIFYYIKYFGYQKVHGYDTAQIKKCWEIVIEDKTHSWLSDAGGEAFAYSYASYRKWSGLSGIASAEKHKGLFGQECGGATNMEYVEKRKCAAELKKEFMSGAPVEKSRFLSIFHEAENLLEKDYAGYLPPADDFIRFLSLDWELLKKKRRRNAQILMEGLKQIAETSLLFDDLNAQDVPLFVPVLIEKDRDALRKFLTGHGIYCPVHWQLSEYHEGLEEKCKTIYRQELSLICDQRYGADDMNKMLEVIAEFYS